MQVHVIFLNEGTCVHQGLLVFLIMLNCFVVTFTGLFGNANRIVTVLMASSKIYKNIGGRLALLTSIFVLCIVSILLKQIVTVPGN